MQAKQTPPKNDVKLPARPLRPRPDMGALPVRAALQTPEAMKYVSLSKQTLRALERKGILHPNRVTGKLLWLVSELDAFLASAVCGSKVYDGLKIRK